MEEQNSLLLPQSVQNDLPTMVKNELRKMSAQKQEEFLEEFNRKKKKVWVGFLLAFFLCYYARRGEWGKQIIFWITGGGLGIWWLYTLLKVWRATNDMNRDIAINIMRDLKAISS